MDNQNIMEIWGKLDYIGLDAEGNIHIIIQKGNAKINSQLIKKAREFTRRRVRIIMKKLPW